MLSVRMGLVPPAKPVQTLWVCDGGGRFDVGAAKNLFDGDFDPVGCHRRNERA